MRSPKINYFELVPGQFQGQAGGRQEVGVEREVQREGALPEPRQDRNVWRGWHRAEHYPPEPGNSDQN